MLRAVLDTNVLVSSVISQKGAPYYLMEAWQKSRFLLITSESIIEETERVLSRPRIRDTFSITNSQILGFTSALKKEATLAFGNADAGGAIPDDPSDEKFLVAALNGNAKIIVSGDKHLLYLKEYRGITILTPREFLDRLEQESSYQGTV